MELDPEWQVRAAAGAPASGGEPCSRLPPAGWCDVCSSPVRPGLDRCVICGEKPYFVLYDEGKRERAAIRAGAAPNASTMTLLAIFVVVLATFVAPVAGAVTTSPEQATVDSIVSSSGDPPFGPSVMVSGPPDPRIIVEWDQAAEPGGNIIAGWIAFDHKMGCGFATSTDDGRTWGQPYFGIGQTGSGGDPVVIPDRSAPGIVYILCLYQDGSGTLAAMSKSTDGGLTWSNWDRGAHEFWDFPDAVADGGTIWLIWNTGKPDTNIVISNDEGKTWGASKYLQDGLPSCILEDSQRRLYVFSGASIISIQKLRFAYSADGGQTWQAGHDLGFTSASRPDCEIDEIRRSLYVVTGSSLRKTVYLVRSRDLGTAFDAPIEIWNGTSTSLAKIDFVTVTVDHHGVVHAGWHDDRNGFLQAWYTNSSDGGTTWRAPILASDNVKPSCAPSCGQAHYGHGLAATATGAVCYGFIVYSNYTPEYRSSCNYDGVGGRTLSKIELSPATASLSADQTLRFTAQGFDTNGAPMGVTPVWSVNGGNVDPSGLYTPDKVGTFDVNARVGSIEGKATVAVTAGALSSIAVSPSAATITSDDTQKFVASGADAKGNPVPVSPAWSSTGGAIDGTGLFTPDKVGGFTVTARDGAASGNSQVTVTLGALASLAIEPAMVTVAADSTLRFTASGKDSKGNDVPVSATWSFSGLAGAGAVDQGGLFSPSKVGTYRVAASAGGLKSEAEVKVVPGKLDRVVIAPKAVSLEVGDLASFSYSAHDSKSNAIEDATATWRVEGGVGEVSAAGEFKASRAGEGSVKVTVSKSGVEKEASATLSVKDGILARLPPYLLVAGVAAGIVGILAAKRRKKKRAEAERMSRESWAGWTNGQSADHGWQ
ncbi:MAG TPA: hypothetical protein VI893_09875 [Thermoplasmata archaeon]|nr:hypothetical protein [Thermoplasmata archaeon]